MFSSNFLRAVNARFLVAHRTRDNLGLQFEPHPAFMREGAGGGTGGGAGGGEGGGEGEGGEGEGEVKLTAEEQAGALKVKNRELLVAQRKLKDTLKGFELEDGKLPSAADVKAALKHLADFRANGGKPTKEQLDQVKQMTDQLEAEYKGKAEPLEKMNKRLSSALERSLKNTAIQQAIMDEDGRAVYLRPLLKDLVRVVPNDEEPEEGADEEAFEPYVLRVVDEKGKVRFNKKGDPLSPRELVAEMRGKDEFSDAFNAPRRSGTGSNTKQGGGSGGGMLKITRAEAEDPQTYRAKKAEAAKAGKTLTWD